MGSVFILFHHKLVSFDGTGALWQFFTRNESLIEMKLKYFIHTQTKTNKKQIIVSMQKE